MTARPPVDPDPRYVAPNQEPFRPPKWGANDDRLATELFTRYGSVERGRFRTYAHWMADADAIRKIQRELIDDGDDGPYWIGFYRGTMAQPIWQRVVLAIAATLFVGFLIGVAVGRSWVV